MIKHASPDSSKLLTGADDKQIHLYDINTSGKGLPVASLGGHSSWVLGCVLRCVFCSIRLGNSGDFQPSFPEVPSYLQTRACDLTAQGGVVLTRPAPLPQTGV